MYSIEYLLCLYDLETIREKSNHKKETIREKLLNRMKLIR